MSDASAPACDLDARLDFKVKGMTCASCVAHVEKALKAVPGVGEVSVNLATERASLRAIGDAALWARVTSAVADAGYEAQKLDAEPGAADRERAARETEMRELRRNLIVASLLAAPVFLLEMGGHSLPGFHAFLMSTLGHERTQLISFALTTMLLAGPGRAFYAKGFPALWHGRPDMNALVATGTASAYLYSVIATFAPHRLPPGAAHVYYEAASVIIALILFGRFLEARAKGQASEAIRALAKLQPNVAHVERDGGTRDIAIEELRVGDLILVKPGERLPTDGEVARGESHIDESMISGEPNPVAKRPGDPVTGGTVNTTGVFAFRATRVGADTLLSGIIRMVEEAQGAKLPIQQLVDRVTGVFVPIVFAIAIMTFLVWLFVGPEPRLAYALVNAVAVLIIACPCAMGLATPAAIMTGTGRAAELGVLFRKGEALQTLRDAALIAFDKTGTLTEGKPKLVELECAGGVDASDVLQAIASLEAQSEHPIAAAIVAAAKAQGLALSAAERAQSVPGMGLVGVVAGREIAVGAARFMAQRGVDVEAFAATAARLADAGASPLYAAIDGKAAALLCVADAVKPTSRAALDALRAMGVRTAMITGDDARPARAVAAQLGIDEVVAGVLPEGKVATLRRLGAGRKFAFVGDGVNDAPALAAADVGVAIGAGTDIAIEAADVVLMSEDLTKVAAAVALSRATMRNIAQNLFWAFAYNAVLIPVAAGALYPSFGVLLSPALGAGAMALSSVFVLTNALRLRRFVPPDAAAAQTTAAAPQVIETGNEIVEEAKMGTTFDVKEMTCGKCVAHVTKAVQTVQPGAEVKVDLATGKVEVSPAPADPQAIVHAVTEAGYPAALAA
jgi:P-type Cu+ transporter